MTFNFQIDIVFLDGFDFRPWCVCRNNNRARYVKPRGSARNRLSVISSGHGQQPSLVGGRYEVQHVGECGPEFERVRVLQILELQKDVASLAWNERCYADVRLNTRAHTSKLD